MWLSGTACLNKEWLPWVQVSSGGCQSCERLCTDLHMQVLMTLVPGEGGPLHSLGWVGGFNNLQKEESCILGYELAIQTAAFDTWTAFCYSLDVPPYKRSPSRVQALYNGPKPRDHAAMTSSAMKTSTITPI